MTETTVTRIGVASLAGMTGVITWGMALLFGWPLLFFEAAIPGTGIVSFILFILLSILGGVITGAVSALIYNFAATFMGGVVLELESSGSS